MTWKSFAHHCPFVKGIHRSPPDSLHKGPQIAIFMGPTWGPHESCRPHVGPMLPHEPCYQGPAMRIFDIFFANKQWNYTADLRRRLTTLMRCYCNAWWPMYMNLSIYHASPLCRLYNPGPLFKTPFIRDSGPGILASISNCIYSFLWDVIVHPCAKLIEIQRQLS